MTASSWTTWVSRYQKGKTSLDLSEARDDGVLGWQWHQLDHMQTDNPTNTSSFTFSRLDALPDAQPTVSKHRRHIAYMCTSNTVNVIDVSVLSSY